MNSNTVENIDIERCKELFEYEMTEVILNLKGEFSKISEKNFAEVDIPDTYKLTEVGPISLQETSKVSIEVPSTKIDPAVAIKEVSVCPLNINVDNFDIESIDISALKLEKKTTPSLDMPAGFSMSFSNLENSTNKINSDIKSEITKVDIPDTNISLPGVTDKFVRTKNSDGKPQIESIEVPSFDLVWTTPDIELDKASIGIFDTSFNVDFSVNKVQRKKIEIPNIDTAINQELMIPAITINRSDLIESIDSELFESKGIKFELSEPVFDKISIDLPENFSLDYGKMTFPKFNTVEANIDEALFKKIDLPESLGKVSTKKPRLDYPEVNGIGKIDIDIKMDTHIELDLSDVKVEENIRKVKEISEGFVENMKKNPVTRANILEEINELPGYDETAINIGIQNILSTIK